MLKQQGETIKLQIEPNWVGKEIMVMPYLKKPTEKVSQKTQVANCKHPDGAIMVAAYIVNEIKTNTKSNIAGSIRYYASYEEYQKRYEEWKNNKSLGKYLVPPEPQNLLKAKALWAAQVFKGRPWDHKPKIKEKFGNFAIERTEYSDKLKGMRTYKSYYQMY